MLCAPVITTEKWADVNVRFPEVEVIGAPNDPVVSSKLIGSLVTFPAMHACRRVTPAELIIRRVPKVPAAPSVYVLI